MVTFRNLHAAARVECSCARIVIVALEGCQRANSEYENGPLAVLTMVSLASHAGKVL
jgi:hypothetical protein